MIPCTSHRFATAVRLPHRFARATRLFSAWGRFESGRWQALRSSLYSPTRPSINWTRAGLSVYPGAAGRGRVGSRIAVIARFGKRYFVANQKKRVQRGRSAASTFDSLAQVWGRPQCGFLISAPNGLPAESISKPKVHAKMHPCRAISKQTYCKIARHD